jgi:PAS domain S-box-containing protein
MPEKSSQSKQISSLEHERLATLINSMADGVIAIDKHMKIALYNGAALSILDSNGSMQGKVLGSVFEPVDKAGEYVDMHSIIRGNKTAYSSRDLSLKYKDGSIAHLYISIAPVRLGYGAQGTEGHVLLLRDITHEKSLEDERSEFISVVSHELRTPIAIAEGNISNAQFVAGKSGDIAQIQKALTSAHDQVLFLAAMVNDLSTLSRAERGKLTLEIEPINVHAFVSEIAATYKDQVAAKGLQLHLQLDPKLELLQSSPLYVREIIQNYITNAIKYTETGSITMSAKPTEGGVEFAVSDTGIGISKSDQKRVFDKFFRSEDFRTRKSTGTGLGLYITSKLAHLLRANISLQSQLNHGSTFRIYIPNLQPEAKDTKDN